MVEKINPLSLPFFYDCIIENNTVYFPLANYNAICRGNLITDQVDIIDIFPDTSVYKVAAYAGIYKFGSFLFFSAYSNDDYDILIYDISQQKFLKLRNNKNMDFRSNTVFEKNNCIYIVSCVTMEIYKIDIQNNSVKCIVPTEYVMDEYRHTEIVQINDSILFPLNQRKHLLTFDLQSEVYKYYKFPSNISNIMTLCHYNDRLWITDENRKIFTWNIKDGKVRECAEFPNDVQLFFKRNGKPIWFGNSFVHKDVLWLFPFDASVILKYNIMTGNFEKLVLSGEEEKDGLEKERFYTIKYGTVKKFGNRVFFLSSKTRILFELDLITNNIQKHYFHVNKKFNGHLYPVSENGKILEKYDAFMLEDFLENLRKNEDKLAIKKEEIIGGTIYSYIDR